jgi:hypothetical protein
MDADPVSIPIRNQAAAQPSPPPEETVAGAVTGRLPLAHSPWKSPARFPHSRRRGEAVEKWKVQKRAFPLSHSTIW